MRIAPGRGRSRVITEVPVSGQVNALRASQFRMRRTGGKGRLQKEGKAHN